MSTDGYYRHPTIHGDNVVFVCEDDLWAVPASGGAARRLTSGLGASACPALSSDGKIIAFSGRDEGHMEVYTMPADGGQPKRLTYLGANSLVTGFTPDGKITFASDWRQPFMKRLQPFAIDRDDGTPVELPTGPANFVSYEPNGKGVVIARPHVDAAIWKRYRGGTAGDIWIDARGDGNFRRLIKLKGNPSRPIWIGQRICFLCDHEGVGNIYSCDANGNELRRHTHHEDFYARTMSSGDARRIAYHAGGDLYVFDSATDKSTKLKIEFHSPRTQRNRKFIEAAKYLEHYEPHPQGHLLGLTVRGRFVTLGNFEGPVQQHGEPAPGRFRLAQWLNDGKRLVVVSDAEGKETLEVHRADELSDPEKLAGLDVGRVVALMVSPKTDQVALTNHRNELMLVDLASKSARILDRSEHFPMLGFDFSPDGKWLAYGCAESLHTSVIKLCRLEDGQITRATKPVLVDLSPTFDPEGKFLYFLSRREFDPVYDGLHFDLGFPKGMRPYLITLRKDIANPFALQPKPPEEPKKENSGAPAGPPPSAEGSDSFSIDLDGVENRIVAFPVSEGIYQQIKAIPGKALFTSVPVEGSLKITWMPGGEPPSKAKLEAWDFATGKCETLVKNITSFAISRDRRTLVYRAASKLRIIKAGEKSDEALAAKPPGRESGWIDLKRVRISVEPPREWRQMFGEAWRLQREHFWVEDLSQVDWQAIYARYLPLLDRVATRTEITDLLWEMQGELGSSHAYVLGGDFRDEPRYDLGFLGADLSFSRNLWNIDRIMSGDAWDEEKGSPLLRPGASIKPGDTILAVNGQRVDENTSPQQLLVNQAGIEVMLTIGDSQGKNARVVPVKTLKAEMPLRYREWVDKNRAYVREKSNGKFGYVHIPNMGPIGYAEFHRGFLAEVDREGLVIDVRYNGGGHVSSLLLEKLARRRRGYVHTRWFGVQPFPDDCPAGPMVAITNEYAGSDGDIFSHNFKQMKLGPLLGKRTWGGVIGIWPRHTLIDGGVTTQPEFSFWFIDVGWNVENYGVDPDIEVEFRPQDYVAGMDPQLDRALEELRKQVESTPRIREFDPRPSLALPRGLGSNGNGNGRSRAAPVAHLP